MEIKTIVAMSGGVDSSVAAFLLKAQGHDVVGITMRLFLNENVGLGKERPCCSLEDISDAGSVSAKMGIPHYVFDFSSDFNKEVIERFVLGYMSGKTPNPCIDCNRYIKFDRLLNKARAFGFDNIATGHYAVIQKNTGGRYLLRKGADETKDQSYVLYSLTQEQMQQVIFPLGSLKKSEVRQIALNEGLINARKRDSQDICFVRNGSYADFIEKYSGVNSEEGDFLDLNGRVIGRHCGHIRYTIGQHKKLGSAASHNSLSVCSKDIKKNTITLGNEKDLYSRTIYVNDINMIALSEISSPMRLKAKIRYKQSEQWAIAEQVDVSRIRIDFDEPQRAPAKGQAAVLYDGDIVVGGGTIE